MTHRLIGAILLAGLTVSSGTIEAQFTTPGTVERQSSLPIDIDNHRVQLTCEVCAQVIWDYDAPGQQGNVVPWHEVWKKGRIQQDVIDELYGPNNTDQFAKQREKFGIPDDDPQLVWLVHLGTLYGNAIPPAVLQVIEQYLVPIGEDKDLKAKARKWVKQDAARRGKRVPEARDNPLLTVRYLKFFQTELYPNGVPIAALLHLEKSKAAAVHGAMARARESMKEDQQPRDNK